MEPKVVNNHNRTANGFFLTSKSETDAKGEHVVYNYAVELLNADLKERHVRSANVLDNLTILEEVVANVTRKVMAICAVNGVPEEGIGAFVWLTAVACMSAYHEKIKRVAHGEGPTPRREQRNDNYNRDDYKHSYGRPGGHNDGGRLYHHDGPDGRPYRGRSDGRPEGRRSGAAGSGPGGPDRGFVPIGHEGRGRRQYDNGGRESRGPYYDAEYAENSRARSKSR